jgi:4,5-dihydroxyphthalate decarboxylase
MLPGMVAELEETRELMGDDWWPYGLEPNVHVLETLMGYAVEQGLMAKRLELETLFAPETLEFYRI